MASGSGDSKIKIWNIESGQCKLTLNGHSNSVFGLTVLKNCEMASSSFDKTIKIWNTDSGECRMTLNGVVISELHFTKNIKNTFKQ